MLTVPEQYAGQLMKCPLCESTFTVPSLPGTASPFAAESAAGPPPAPPPASEPEPDVYSIRHEPEPEPPPPAVSTAPAPEPGDITPDLADTTRPSPVADLHEPAKPSPEPSAATRPLPPEGYREVATLWFSPRVIHWFAPVGVVLIFFLQFFPWVGLYRADKSIGTQNAWQAAFNGGAFDPLALNLGPEGKPAKEEGPGISGWTIWYVLLFLLLALPLTVFSLVLHFHHVKLPAEVARFVPWRWGLVAVVNFVVFLFLALQLAVGFSLEARPREVAAQLSPPKEGSQEMYLWARAGILEAAERTVWLRFAFVLHVLVILGAAYMYWVTRPGVKRPAPRLDLMW
jgi:hypothetical protein